MFISALEMLYKPAPSPMPHHFGPNSTDVTMSDANETSSGSSFAMISEPEALKQSNSQTKRIFRRWNDTSSEWEEDDADVQTTDSSSSAQAGDTTRPQDKKHVTNPLLLGRPLGLPFGRHRAKEYTRTCAVSSANSKYLARTAHMPKHFFVPSEETKLARGDASPFKDMAAMPPDNSIFDRYNKLNSFITPLEQHH